MYPSTGLLKALDEIRETSIANNTLYHTQVPAVDVTTSISAFGQPILDNPAIANEFISALINRIAYTAVDTKNFNNKLAQLKGEERPLGYASQEIYVNPAQSREYNVNDFAGILAKYEADVKVQYTAKNVDRQFPVSITRQELKKAFVSWGDFESFIDSLVNSLYNGLYITEYEMTKGLVSSAYKDNTAIVQTISGISTADDMKALIKKLRALFLNMQLPSREYNAWYKIGGEGRPINTWNMPEDTVLLIRNDILSEVDVEVLASAFNMGKTDFLGRVIGIDSFDQYDETGTKVFDGSNIVCFIGDKRWFMIHDQETFIDQWYNANNRVWNYYLNYVSQYAYSFFANGVIIALADPTVTTTALAFTADSANVAVGKKIKCRVKATPKGANSTVTFSSGDTDIFTVTKIDDQLVEVTGVADGTATLTASAESGSVTDTMTIVVGTGGE